MVGLGSSGSVAGAAVPSAGELRHDSLDEQRERRHPGGPASESRYRLAAGGAGVHVLAG